MITSSTTVIRKDGKAIRMAFQLFARPKACVAYICPSCRRDLDGNLEKKREFTASCEMDIQEMESEYFDLFAR